jgi:hypothetical protein
MPKIDEIQIFVSLKPDTRNLPVLRSPKGEVEKHLFAMSVLEFFIIQL